MNKLMKLNKNLKIEWWINYEAENETKLKMEANLK